MSPALDLGYRAVAMAACIYCGSRVRRSLAERKFTAINSDLLDWWTPTQVFHRDTAPIRYWMFVCGEAATTVLCLAGAIVGYWQPNG